jgi:hypothetical protein
MTAGTTDPSSLAPYFRRLEDFSTFRWVGRVTKVVDYLVESEGPFCSVGEGCAILTSDGRTLAGEIVGFREKMVLSMPLERPVGIRYGDRIVTRGTRPCLRVGPGLLGRVIDGAGEPLDSRGSYGAREYWPLRGEAPLPLTRTRIGEPLGCGIRAIDGLLTCGRGQRMGIFGGSGVGKSTLVGMMTRGTSADLTVLALVGERGREVREFLEDALGEEGLARSVVVVSTSDQPPLSRIRAALAATTIAEYFAAQGRQVLLVTDSLTRFAMAQREIGLAAGEPPTAKGYTPSVFTLARAVARARRPFRQRQHHRFLHRPDGGRRPAGSPGGRGALPARRAHRAGSPPGRPRALSPDLGARQPQPSDARGVRPGAPAESGAPARRCSPPTPPPKTSSASARTRRAAIPCSTRPSRRSRRINAFLQQNKNDKSPHRADAAGAAGAGRDNSMAFVFPLQGVLRVRELQERSELQGLQALAAQVAAARAEIAAWTPKRNRPGGRLAGRIGRNLRRGAALQRRTRVRLPGTPPRCCTQSCRNGNSAQQAQMAALSPGPPEKAKRSRICGRSSWPPTSSSSRAKASASSTSSSSCGRPPAGRR